MSIGGDGTEPHERQEPPVAEGPVPEGSVEDTQPEEVLPYDAVTEAMTVVPPESAAPPEQTATNQPSKDDEEPTTEAYSAVPPRPVEPVVAPRSPEPPITSPAASSATPDPAGAGTVGSDRKPPWVKAAVLAGAAVAILAVFYTADWLSSSGAVPRGVTVAGVDVGSLSHDDAEAKLRSELGARVEQPVAVDAGDLDLEFVPAAAGLGVDWNATLDRAGSQPINPFTRIASFFGHREIGVESTVDAAALDATVESIRAQTDRAPVEGDIVFEGATAVGVVPAPGLALDVAGAREAMQKRWAFGDVAVPVETADVTVHQDEVDRVLTQIAEPAVSAPVVFTGKNAAAAVLAPEVVGQVVSFEPGEDGSLAARYDNDAAIRILAPQLAATETVAKDASFVLGSGAPTIVPGVVGDMVQWPVTLEQLPTLLASSDARTTAAVYAPAPPALTTEGAQALGIKEVVAEYTTGGFEYASGVNIRLTADIVNGALVKPGATFSLNGYTGPRGTAQGFVESGIIDNGRPDRAVGGGISQFATTLYNAAYFGGMEDAGHTEHSYYISRYPEAREATVFEGAIDLKFTNPAKTGIVIESFGTGSDVTVRLWGTKTVEVGSSTGPRTNPTSPNTVTLPAGEQCVPSSGGPGFTASNTRVITDIASGKEISRDTRTVKYDPIPIVKCQSREPDPKPADAPPPAPAPAPAPPAAEPAAPPAAGPAAEPAPVPPADPPAAEPEDQPAASPEDSDS